MIRHRPLACLGALLAAAACGGPASAAERLVTIPSDGPGPPEVDNVYVHEFGPARASRVLVLMPGTIGGAGDFTLIARDLIRRVDDLAVWAIDRRSQALEDTSVFAKVEAREATPRQAFDYYLGWLSDPSLAPTDHFDFLDASQHPYAREWGMKTALDDARQVVLAARRGGREVLLGGHSLGASLTAAYGAWDFGGRPGYKDIDGMVLIDGGLLGSFDGYDLAQAREQIATLQSSNPFTDLLGLGIPEAAGLFAEVGGYYAKLEPTASAETLQSFPLLPAEFKPPFPVTDRALLGHAFDRETSPEELTLLHVNAGHLAESGDPRDWVDAGVTTAARLAAGLAQEPSNGVEWYFPTRLTIDTTGADRMKRNDVGEFLGLRLFHTSRIDVPIYAFQTDLSDGDVLRGARRLVKRARTVKRDAVLVNGAPRQSHLDPLFASPRENEFLRTVVPFIERAAPSR